MQTVCRPKVLPFLRERIDKPGQSAHLHSDGEVLAFHDSGADSRGIGIIRDFSVLVAAEFGEHAEVFERCHIAFDIAPGGEFPQ